MISVILAFSQISAQGLPFVQLCSIEGVWESYSINYSFRLLTWSRRSIDKEQRMDLFVWLGFVGEGKTDRFSFYFSSNVKLLPERFPTFARVGKHCIQPQHRAPGRQAKGCEEQTNGYGPSNCRIALFASLCKQSPFETGHLANPHHGAQPRWRGHAPPHPNGMRLEMDY